MTDKTFRITGRVIDQTGQGVEGLRLEAWDKDLIFHDLVGSAETGSEGSFEMQFEESYFKEIFARRPDLFFKIFRQDELIPGAEFEIQVQLPTGKTMKGSGNAVFCKVASGTTNVTIKLQIPAASQLFKIHGQVLEPDGRPVVGAKVIAFDIRLQNVEVELGEGITDEAGRYEITYEAELFLKANKKRPDLDVRAYNQQGDKIAWLLEPPIYNAKQVVTVDLIVGGEAYKGPSEYQQIMDTLSPLLQDLELSELTDEDVDFLAGKTGTSSEQIVHLVLASRYAKKSELPPELFYGLFRQNLPTSLPALLAQSPDIVHQAMDAAVNANIVPTTVSFEQVWERFQELAVDHAFEPFDPVPEGKATLGELLETVEISVDQQREFLGLYVRHEGPIAAFWHGLEETSLQPYVSNLQFTLQLGVLTQNNIPLVQHLKDSSDSLKALASLNLEEWEDKAATYGIPPDVPGKDQEAKVRNYAHTIVRMVEDAFPTAVTIHKINLDEDIPGKADLLQFFVNNSEFKFGSMPIDQYLKENTSALAGIDDTTGLIRQLKTMDRLFRICPRFERYEAMKVLMEDGFNSTQSIAMMGQRSFSTQYAEKLGNFWKAKAIYTNAAQMTAMTLAVHAKYSYAFNQPGMYVLPDIAKRMQDIPDWETLFGSFKLCDCEHCESVLSPSAYLVDLLAFLRDHMLKKKHISGPLYDVNSALGVLSDRRRDIEHINLSCENTNTPVPYVDLVNEILENAVSYNQDPDYPQYYQTTGTADELGANPEYLNVYAYNTLAEEIYPWSLPFDLWTEEARTYLNHLGVSRYNLLETFQKNGENPTPNDLALASEYLGLATKEQEIITDSSPSEPWLYWGLKEEDTLPDPTDIDETINWVELLRRVPIFLEKSGLTYKELDELLNTRFINPGRFADPYDPEVDISVEFPDAFCNLEEAELENLGEEALKKIHRFVRLLRKIGWTARELDIVLKVLIAPHFMGPAIDSVFLLKLWHVHRLHTALKVPLIDLISFWSRINTDDHRGKTRSSYDQLFLNKAVLNPEDMIFLLNKERNELQAYIDNPYNPPRISGQHALGVLAALEISDAELALLIGQESTFSIDWTPELQSSLNNRDIPHDLRKGFADSGNSLSESPDVSVEEADSKWLITDDEVTYKVRKEANKIVISRLMFSVEYTDELRDSLDDASISDDLKQDFEENGISLSDHADVTVVEAGSRWLIADNECMYDVSKEEDKLNIYSHEKPEVPDVLNLDNLSKLYRIVTLSRALRLSIKEFLSIKKLTGLDPFLDPYDPKHLEVTLHFVGEAQNIRKSGFSISELNYLLLHVYRESEGIALIEEEIALILGEIRDGLQKIASENTYVPDPTGELIRSKLALLITADKIESAVILINGTLLFDVEWTQELQDELNNGNMPGELRLRFKENGISLSENPDISGLDVEWLVIDNGNKYTVDKEEKTLRIYADWEKFFDIETVLFGIDWTQELQDELNNGNMPEKLCQQFRENEISLSENPDISHTDVEWLIIDDGRTYIVRKEEETLRIYVDWKTFIATYFSIFLNVDEAVEKLVELSSHNFIPEKEERLKYVQMAILDYLCSSFVIEKTASIFSLSLSTTEQLLTRWVRSLKDSKSPSITEYLESGFIESEELLTMEDFRDQFATFILLQKIVMIITKLEVKTEELPLLFQRNSGVWGDRGWADLNFLPLSVQENSSALFSAAEKLFDLFSFRDILLPGEPTLFEILNMAFNPEAYRLDEFLQALSERTGWKLADLQHLTHWFGFALHDFRQVYPLITFTASVKIVKRLGVSAEQLVLWTTSDLSFEQARSIKQAVKAKYDDEQWLAVAKPLRDDLREKQRSTLVSYLIAHYAFPDKTFKDSNDLYAHFLIDPEMDPCMMTSRLKLATSTIQLFIQRCLMNLEEWKIPNATIAQEWSSQWKWMKNYRVWEANRKVFLYPENWIEPELRDDKSPFFKDLENELLQNEITAENVEKGFLNYLEKLDAVARLEICGMYHEQESEGQDGIGKRPIDILHVFGRTRGTPHIYYYRRRIATGAETMYWTPWERVDLDIEGDHLIPVVWNRRLYLFWPIFAEKATEKIPEENARPEDKKPDKYWEIKVAWSEYKNGKWSAKKTSNQSIIPEKISTESWENYFFGNTLLPHLLKKEFYFNGIIINEEFVIKCGIHAWNWIDVEGISSTDYSYEDLPSDQKIYAESLPLCDLRFKGCNGEILLNVSSPNPLAGYHASYVHPEYMIFIEDEKNIDNKLIIQHDDILWKTPGLFRLIFPHQYSDFFVQDSFFYQDNTRTFFVTPRGTRPRCTSVSDSQDIYDPNPSELEWHISDRVQVEDIDRYLPSYFEFISQYEHWEEMFPPIQDIDPPIVDETFPVGTYYDETVEHAPGYGVFGTRTETGSRLPTKRIAYSLLSRHTSMAMTYYALAKSTSEKRYLFETFYHPYVCEFVKYLNREGIDGLLQRCVQMMEPLLFSINFTAELQSSLDDGIFPEDLRRKFEAEQIRLSDDISVSAEEEEGRRWGVVDNEKVRKYTVKKEDNKLNIYIYELLFENIYDPNESVVDTPHPYEDVDFESDGSYSLYNWEMFFHAPLMVADRLSKNQRFAEAQKWFHYIFDPTDTSTHDIPQKYWKLRPFFEAAEEDSPETLEDLLTKEKEKLEKQVNEWKDNPFKPHLIARMRIMTYQKTVVMKYIDNLIAWGDQLFRRDTIESINEATQLYILAAEILGKRPEDIPPHTEPPVKTFNDLIEGGELDALSNRMVEEENYLSSPKSVKPMISARAHDMQMIGPSLYLCCPSIAHNGQEDKELLYFCIPKNQKLLSYWDTVADRLFKIRHCMTIEGVVRQLPLFEPPIDPGLLVRAAAAGVDISSALNDLNAPLPHYRFQFMLQKAIEFCADVRSLGASSLSALEKKDAEELALLRSSQEVDLLKAIKEIKQKQIDEAIETKASLEHAKALAGIRTTYYQEKLGLENKPPLGEIPTTEKLNLIPHEKEQLDKLRSANVKQEKAMLHEFAAQVYSLYPDITLGTSGTLGSPVITAQIGGSLYATGMRAFAAFYNMEATKDSSASSLAAIMGGHHRVAKDWALQLALAVQEEEQINKQILAAEIRKAIAEKDLENHDIQIENAEEVNTFMKEKFTDQELYNWMVSQISTIYFQSYQMAYDLAKRAEKAFQHELGDYNATFIKFGYWDSLKKGLLSGEKLHYDLKRMETGYLEKNKREYEITKHISPAMLDPVDLIKLKETGECFVNIPEAIFDLDYPGHYMRRIKSVSLTVPCVTGPYTSLNCTLTLLKNSVRIESSATGEYARDENGDDPRFRDNIGAIQSIATSHGQNDSGVFELNFRDERYLPFEGAGAISQWRIEMPKEFRPFDYDTISDVILHLRYTAREGGKALRDAAVNQLQDAVNTLAEDGTILPRLVSARHEFPSEWHQFLHSADSQGELNFELYKDRFPFMFRDKKININRVGIYLKPKNTIGDSFELTVDSYDVELKKDQSLGNILCDCIPLSREVPNKNDPDASEKAVWTIKAKHDIAQLVNDNEIKDLFILLYYSIE